MTSLTTNVLFPIIASIDVITDITTDICDSCFSVAKTNRKTFKSTVLVTDADLY